MKVRFIFPKWQKLLEANPELEKMIPGYYFGDFNMPGLSIESVVSLTPEDIEISLTDDHLENIDFEEDVDLVALTSFTPQASRAYKIADKFREKKVPVVMGGIHPTLIPEEAGNHADHVIIGRAEGAWQSFLNDFKKGTARKFYRNGEDGSIKFPKPRRDLFRRKGYSLYSITIISRGCKYNCPACIIPYVDGRDLHLRPIEEVVRDISEIEVENVFIADESLFLVGEEYRTYAKELFTALIPLEKKLFVTAIGITSFKDDLLKLAKKAGVKEVYVVFAYPPISLSLLSENLKKKVADSLKKIHDNGMEIFASFGLGFDYDDKSIFEKSIKFACEIECELAEFFIATPFPKTPYWRKLKKENRLLHENWELYNSANVVFNPKNMSVEELRDGYIQCWKEYYKDHSFTDFGTKFSRYWGKDKEELEQMYDKKREIKKKDILK